MFFEILHTSLALSVYRSYFFAEVMIDCIVRNYLSLSLCFVKYATHWKYFHIKVAEVFTSGTSHTCRNLELYCSSREIVNTTLVLYMVHSFVTCSGFSCWPFSSHVEVYSVSWSFWPEDRISINIQNIAHMILSNNKFSTAEQYKSIIEKVTNMLLSGRSFLLLMQWSIGCEGQLRPAADNRSTLRASCDPQKKTLLCHQSIW